MSKTFLEQVEECKNQTLLVLCEYLKTRTDLDLNNEDKNIDELFDYIVAKAKKEQTNNCAFVSDEVVYGWASHYYIESKETMDKEIKELGSVKLKSSGTTKSKEVEEIEEEIEEEVKVEIQVPKKKPKKVRTECEGQLDLFKL